MGKIRFIVEVDEEYIREHADMVKVADSITNGNRGDVIGGFLDFMSFSLLEKKISQGVKELFVNLDSLKERDHSEPIFDKAVSMLSSLSCLMMEDNGNEGEN